MCVGVSICLDCPPTYVFFIALGTEQYLAQCVAHSLEIGHPQ